MQDEQEPTQPAQPRIATDLPIKEHVLMVNDLPRGQAFLDAMREKIRPGDVVLEVGTGAGLLACMAVRLGAKRVYTVEQSPQLHRVATQVFEANGVADRVTLINAHSKNLVELGVVREPVNVFVTETIGTQGLDEGIIPIFQHVKPLLAPDARLIPESVVFRHCLVNMTGIRERFEVLHPIFGFDLSALNAEIESNNVYWLNPIEPWREVSSRGETRRYDLLDFDAASSVQELTISKNDVCDGMFTWADFKLSERCSLETRYTHLGCSWANSVHFMERCLVDPGHTCRAEFRIADDKVSWSMNWTIGPRRSDDERR
ncbi:MAG: 50S ribosomal protein L11 methyltransferase [Myxococcota bacterium]